MTEREALQGLVARADIETLRGYHDSSFLDPPSYHDEVGEDSLWQCVRCSERYIERIPAALADARRVLEETPDRTTWPKRLREEINQELYEFDPMASQEERADTLSRIGALLLRAMKGRGVMGRNEAESLVAALEDFLRTRDADREHREQEGFSGAREQQAHWRAREALIKVLVERDA